MTHDGQDTVQALQALRRELSSMEPSTAPAQLKDWCARWLAALAAHAEAKG